MRILEEESSVDLVVLFIERSARYEDSDSHELTILVVNSLPQQVDAFERAILEQALAAHNGSYNFV